ncbi:hypothetical protein JCM19233_816 [Vibrio astriarenae]|nr:hypothetical protein JCM19233_816 [Vibrio sp. C7]
MKRSGAFFQRFGATPCERVSQASVMDMYWLREEHAGSWYFDGRFALIDEVLDEQARAFLAQEARENQLMGELEHA